MIKIEVKQIGRHKIAKNGLALISIDGKEFTTIRQGTLGFWAGKFRSNKDLTKEMLDLIDETLDAALKLFDKGAV